MPTQKSSLILTFSLLAALSAPAAWSCDGEEHAAHAAKTDAQAEQTPPAGSQVAVLKVKKMACSSCAGHIKAALEGVQGVKLVRIDARKKTAQVYYMSAATRPASLLKAVEDAGYAASLAD